MILTRRAFTAALSLTGLGLLAGFSPLRLITEAMAQTAADVAKPVALPDMALGPANAAVTITEFASMTCPHCAAFTEKVFPKIKSEYIDSGKIRFVFREFPLPVGGSISLDRSTEPRQRSPQLLVFHGGEAFRYFRDLLGVRFTGRRPSIAP